SEKASSKFATTNPATRKNRRATTPGESTTPERIGISGLCPPPPAAVARTVEIMEGTRSEGEGERDADDGQSLGEREAQNRDRLQAALRLGLTRHAVDVGGEDQTDADAGAHGRQAVPDHVQGAEGFEIHGFFPFVDDTVAPSVCEN